MNAALELELAKARRSTVFGGAAGTLVLGVPALTTGFFVLARAGGGSAAAAKAAAMVTELTLTGLVQMVGQVLSVAVLTAVGIALAWCVGREFVDDAFPALFATATPRRTVVSAKLGVVLVGAVVAVLLSVLVTLAAGVLLGLDLDARTWRMAGTAVVAGTLAAVLSTPLAWVASWRRGYLAGFVALLGLVVLTQVVTALGGGGWFPYAAPSLWMGLGGPEAAARVGVGQLLLAPAVGVLGAAATVFGWDRAEVV